HRTRELARAGHRTRECGPLRPRGERVHHPRRAFRARASWPAARLCELEHAHVRGIVAPPLRRYRQEWQSSTRRPLLAVLHDVSGGHARRQHRLRPEFTVSRTGLVTGNLALTCTSTIR